MGDETDHSLPEAAGTIPPSPDPAAPNHDFNIPQHRKEKPMSDLALKSNGNPAAVADDTRAATVAPRADAVV